MTRVYSSYLADLLQFVQYTIVHLSTFLSVAVRPCLLNNCVTLLIHAQIFLLARHRQHIENARSLPVDYRSNLE